jgi:formate hydrogenlyase subunit 6/NADH:ubiquinone oxidoreductase subunit I
MLGSGIARGMMTTLWHFFFAKSVTLQYPEERLELPPWTRGPPRRS